MATAIINAVWNNATTANFRDWGSKFSNQLAAFGLVKTSDAGQIDWTTATVPTDLSSTLYEMWRFNDSIQAINPIYIKIRYASSASSIRNYISIGHGSDGNGNLTGFIAPEFLSATQSKYDTITSSVISGDASRVAFCINLSSTDSMYKTFFYVERTKDTLGNNTVDGIEVVGTGPNTASTYYYLPREGTPITSTVFVSAYPATRCSYGSNVGIFPIYPCCGYSTYPTLGGVIYNNQDITVNGQIITVPLLGSNHPFITTGLGNLCPTNGAFAMRYE